MVEDATGNSKLFLINIVWAILLFVIIIGFVFFKSLKKENQKEKDEFD